ncbi:MAG: GNAT family N-acetyltransferase [Oscillospiraceae bacterium]|nr:GNAT family N-acetyltransferase [Oscillospiraceae bacterium]
MDIPDLNLFMVCRKADPAAAGELPEGFFFDTCRPGELDIWKAFPFDTPEEANEYKPYMDGYFDRVYAPKAEEFFARCIFVRNERGEPAATAFLWDAYGKVPTLHWVKTRKEYENRGIGRALLAKLLLDENAPKTVCLHTQPGSFRAIKLYTDFGFAFITDEAVGPRHNDLQESLPYLKKAMPAETYEALRFEPAPAELLAAAAESEQSEF